MKSPIYVATHEQLEQLIDKAVRGAINQNNKISKNAPEIMNVEQASEFLNLATATIYVKTSRNELPHKKKGNKLYFIREELEKWILEGNVKTNDDIDAEAMDYLLKNSDKKQ